MPPKRKYESQLVIPIEIKMRKEIEKIADKNGMYISQVARMAFSYFIKRNQKRKENENGTII